MEQHNVMAAITATFFSGGYSDLKKPVLIVATGASTEADGIVTDLAAAGIVFGIVSNDSDIPITMAGTNQVVQLIPKGSSEAVAFPPIGDPSFERVVAPGLVALVLESHIVSAYLATIDAEITAADAEKKRLVDVS
jgi:hypothetical protein